MEEIDIIFPEVILTNPIKQLSCANPNAGTAELLATARESDGTIGAYTFEWKYEGSTTLPPTADAPILVGNTSRLGSLITGRYDVVATNTVTGCTATALFIVVDESPNFKPVINTGTEPVTNCSSPNGGIFGKAVPFTDANGVDTYPLFPYSYKIDIYTGDQSGTLNENSADGDLASVPDVSAGVNVLISAVSSGFYTVRIIDNKTGCYSVKADQVFSIQTIPVVDIVEDNPLINCDPAEANGQLSAYADNGQVGGYSFEWYAGSIASGNLLSDRNRLIGQAAGDFTVRVTNNTSTCFTDATGTITDGTIPSPMPDPELLSDRLSCINPDGQLRVTVGGETLGYNFEWYDAADGTGTNFATNPRVINLDIGTYSVIAFDNITGCESLPANIDIGDQRLYPEFTFESEGSKCDDDTGLARIIITNDAIVTNVFWTQLDNGAGLGLGSEINFLAPGDYQADVTTIYGCEDTGTTTVGTVITNYNLVSPDGSYNEGVNNNFQIDCITNFPENNVKIFNRAGVLVYKIDGYNNADKSFIGIGENGSYPIGDELPNGTYYYVINKGDGSKLIAGFLELIR
jgi:hypothetical protein